MQRLETQYDWLLTNAWRRLKIVKMYHVILNCDASAPGNLYAVQSNELNRLCFHSIRFVLDGQLLEFKLIDTLFQVTLKCNAFYVPQNVLN